MKNIIIKTIIYSIFIFLTAILMISAYYLLIDIQTKTPNKIEEQCQVQEEQFMGRKIFIIEPTNQEKSKTKILYFHGGAYVAETSEKHWDFIKNIVQDTGATIILPDYPLTPKYNYKDVFAMVVPLYKEIIEKVDVKELIIMGDSAGGGISLALEEKLGKEKIPMPSKTILISPWIDVRLTNPKIDEIQKYDKQLNKETLKLAGIAYSGIIENEEKKEETNYLVNPIDGELSKLKNVTIITGTYDILNPDVQILKEKAKEAGSEIEVIEYPEAGHIWMIEKNSSEELVQQGYQNILSLIVDNL